MKPQDDKAGTNQNSQSGPLDEVETTHVRLRVYRIAVIPNEDGFIEGLELPPRQELNLKENLPIADQQKDLDRTLSSTVRWSLKLQNANVRIGLERPSLAARRAIELLTLNGFHVGLPEKRRISESKNPSGPNSLTMITNSVMRLVVKPIKLGLTGCLRLLRVEKMAQPLQCSLAHPLAGRNRKVRSK